MPKTDTPYNDEYIYDGYDIKFQYDPLCGSSFEDPDRYALRTNKILLDFDETD